MVRNNYKIIWYLQIQMKKPSRPSRNRGVDPLGKKIIEHYRTMGGKCLKIFYFFLKKQNKSKPRKENDKDRSTEEN